MRLVLARSCVVVFFACLGACGASEGAHPASAPPPQQPSEPAAPLDEEPAATTLSPGTDESCRASVLCRDEGRCRYDRSRSECEASSEEDCRSSRGCRDEGRCRYVPRCSADVPCAGLDGSRCEP